MGVTCPRCRRAPVNGGRPCPDCAWPVPPEGRSLVATIGYVCAFGAAAWVAHGFFAALSPTPAAISSSTSTPAPTAAPSTSWTEVDLGDVEISMPGFPESQTGTESIGASTATFHANTIKRDGNMFNARALTLHPLVGSTCNTTGAVDGAATGAIGALRNVDGVGSIVVVKNDRTSLPGMPGREVEVRVTPARSSERPFTVRAAYFGRGCRVYDAMAATADATSDADARQMIGSMRVKSLPTGATTPTATPRPATTRPSSPEEDEAQRIISAGAAPAMYADPSLYPPPAAGAPTMYADPSMYAPPAGAQNWGAAPPAPNMGKPVYVHGYTKGNGTYVQPHTRAAPRR